MLLHVAEPQGVSLNAGELKGLIKLFKTLDPHCEHDNLMKKFVSICTDAAYQTLGVRTVFIRNLKRITHRSFHSDVYGNHGFSRGWAVE